MGKEKEREGEKEKKSKRYMKKEKQRNKDLKQLFYTFFLTMGHIYSCF